MDFNGIAKAFITKKIIKNLNDDDVSLLELLYGDDWRDEVSIEELLSDFSKESDG